jgi:hypothetical protein
LTIDTGTAVIGTGTDFSGTGNRDVFLRASTGQVIAWEFNGSGQLIAGGPLTFDGSSWDIDTGTMVVGTGVNLWGNGGSDVFYRLSTGQVAAWEFNSSDEFVAGTPLTVNGSAWDIDTATTVIGTGVGLWEPGGRDVFYRTATGQVVAWEFNGSGQFIAGAPLSFDGSAWDVDVGTTVIGAATNLWLNGGHDIFYRTSSGQMVSWEFNTSGQFIAGAALTNANGSAFDIGVGVEVLGTAHLPASTNESDIFLRSTQGYLQGCSTLSTSAGKG